MPLSKILFLTTQLPYPPNSGGTVKSWNYVKHLSNSCDLTVGSLLKDEDEKHESLFLENITLTSYFSEPVHLPRTPINLIKSYFQAPCLNVFRNYSPGFKALVEKASKDSEILIIDHYEVFQYVPKDFKGKIVMHTHNAEFMLWQRMSELTNNLIKKLILKLEAIRVKKYEEAIFNRSDLIYSTPSDIELYQKYGFNVAKHKTTFHLGNDSLLELPDLNFNDTEKAIGFMGTLSWEPNIDGLIWFITNVWPLVKEKNTNVVFYIMGKKPDQRILDSIGNDQQIKLTGFVKNLDDYLKRTRVYIAPLRFGSGMKVKVLEGLYRGVPSVCTHVAAEGLEIESGKHVFIEDTTLAFAVACNTLLENENTWNKFRDNSREIAKAKYTWKDLFKRMDESMRTLA